MSERGKSFLVDHNGYSLQERIGDVLGLQLSSLPPFITDLLRYKTSQDVVHVTVQLSCVLFIRPLHKSRAPLSGKVSSLTHNDQLVYHALEDMVTKDHSEDDNVLFLGDVCAMLLP